MLILLAAVLLVCTLSFCAYATFDSTKPYHYLNDIYMSDSQKVSVDNDGNGVIDNCEDAVMALYLNPSTAKSDTSSAQGKDKTSNLPSGCVRLDNTEYNEGEWMACPTGDYAAGVSDDKAKNQDVLCCPFPGFSS